MTSNNYGLLPTRHKAWYVITDDCFPENRSSKYVTDRSVGRLPHFLEFKFFHSSLIRSDGGTLYPNIVLLDGCSTVERYYKIIASLKLVLRGNAIP